MALSSVTAQKLADAASRLQANELFAGRNDAVSVLVPAQESMLYVEPGDTIRLLSLSSPLQGNAALHAASYRLRRDAGAIATLSSRWSLLAARTGAEIPPVFDEQVRHIGRSWPAASADGLAKALGKGGNAGMVGGRLLVLGVTLNRMVFNAELFEKCAKAYVLAKASGHAVGRIPWWVRAVAGRRLLADERRAAADHVAGRETPELQAY